MAVDAMERGVQHRIAGRLGRGLISPGLSQDRLGEVQQSLGGDTDLSHCTAQYRGKPESQIANMPDHLFPSRTHIEGM